MSQKFSIIDYMLNYRLALLFFLSIFTISPLIKDAYAVADRCPRHIVKTELKSKKDKTRFLSGSLNGINDYLNTHNVLAFVKNPLKIKSYYKFDVKDVGNNKYCVVLERIMLHYRSSPSIVMPSEFSKKSCEYKIIRKHEQRHLDVHDKYYDKSVKKYQVFLGRIARNVPIHRPVTSDREVRITMDNIVRHLDEQLAEKISNSIDEMQNLQKKIDSPQEYIFTNRKINRCNKLEARNKRANKKAFYDDD